MGAAVKAAEIARLGILPGRAKTLADAINRVCRDEGIPSRGARTQERAWFALRGRVLDVMADRSDFALHQFLFHYVYQGRPRDADPPAAWAPTPDVVRLSNLESLRREHRASDYAALHRWSAERRDEFWQTMIRRLRIRFAIPPDAIRDPKSPIERPDWLPGARLNIADSCFQTAASKPAILHASEDRPQISQVTYGELEALTNRIANGLDGLGLGDHDPVILYMPMTPESVAAYLGIIRSGRPVVGIADASAPPDLANKARISGAKLVITVDSYARGGKRISIYDKVVDAKAPRAVVLGNPQKLRPGDVAWERFLSPKTSYASRLRNPGDTTNILFSSGTTKDPKAIPWTHTTPIKAAADAHLHHDVHLDDVLAWPTSFGWMMGPWLTYATLIHSATMALYNGDPRTRGFAEFVEKARVTILGTVPKLVAVWRASEFMRRVDWRSVRVFSSTGETSDPDDMLWLMHAAGYRPIIEYCGGTEIGGGYITSTVVQPNAPGHFTTPAMGLDFHVLDEDGQPAQRGEVGIVPPSMGLSNDLLNYDHGEEYFRGFHKAPDGTPLRRHGDLLERRGSGYRHLGRKKDMINVFGVKTSSEEIRNVLEAAAVSDTKPVAIDVNGDGRASLVVYAVPKDPSDVGSSKVSEALRAAFNQQIKTRLNPLLAHVEDVVLVAELPQAGPGKTLTAEWFQADYRKRREASPKGR